jgi:hypothetical protein
MTRVVGLISALVLSHLAVAGALAAPTTESHRRAAPPNQYDGKIVDPPVPTGPVAAARSRAIRHAIKVAARQRTEAPREPLPTSSPDQLSPRQNQVSQVDLPPPTSPAVVARSHLTRHARKVAALAPAEAPREPLPTGAPDQLSPQEEQVSQVDLPPPAAVARSRLMRHAIKITARAPVEPPPGPLPPISEDRLTPQEKQVSQIATQNGDREFLMVDKPSGRLILFEDGKPVLMGAALTGLSTADRLPPGALSEKFAQLEAPADKVTPAGRYTVTPGYDKEYGPLFDVKEIKGKDWAISIHQVYLGTPSEHRAERIRSPNEADKHITFGCINVTVETMRVLVRELPKDRATPLYVLPTDEVNTAAYFEQDNT